MSDSVLTVLAPGLYTLVVDAGRPRHRSRGVPVGGAADQAALALGNALVGNAPDAAALEITLAGPTLRAECDLGCVLYGAPFDLVSDRQALRAGRTFQLRAGETLTLGGTRSGARAYLCVRGGLQTPEILGSRSALAPLRAGDRLPCLPGVIGRRSLGNDPLEKTPDALRVLPGAQADWFDLRSFHEQTFVVQPASNRMGLRLGSEPLTVPPRELVSEPVCPGTVQVTRDGQCIVLGVDGQTIGGYPKIAQVISADLDRLGQLRPGEALRFRPVSLPVAEQAWRERQSGLREQVVRLRTSVGAIP